MTPKKTTEAPWHWRRAAGRGQRLWRSHWRLFLAWGLVAVVAVVTAFQLLPGRAPSHTPTSQADYAVAVGIPGLRWGDVEPEVTPTLWRLAEEGAVGSLSVESAASTTCPMDGWLTLSAGSPAASDGRMTDGECPDIPDGSVEPSADNGSAYVNQLELVANTNRQNQPGVEIGSLPGSVRCTTGVGPGGAWAAASPTGRVDRYAPALPNNPEDITRLVTECLISIIDLGRLPSDDAERADALRVADAELGRLVEALPPNALLLVAGLSDTTSAPHLHTVIAHGGGFEGGWLTASGTGREGYLQLIDLAPTMVAALDRPMPRPFTGVTAAVVDGQPADVDDLVAQLADVDAEAAAQQDAIMRFLAILTLAGLILFLAASPVLQRIRRGAGPGSRRPPGVWTFRVVVSSATALALSLPAATLVDFVPWWRAEHSMVALLASTFFIVLIMTALVMMAPKRRSSMG